MVYCFFENINSSGYIEMNEICLDIFVINLILNSNESNMVTDMKNIESSIDFDSNNEVYNINNNSSVDKIVIVLMVKI
jgi:hypothetical protein